MAVDIATLGIKVDATGAIQGLNTVESGISRLTKAAAALGITLGAGAIFGKMVKESIDAQYAMAQLEARVKSTGMAAGFSAAQLAGMASEMQGLTQYSDEAIMSAQSLLLTFTKIKGDTLPQATLAVANLATAMGTDLKSAAIQVGKALNDPEQGLTALRRSGVSFTDAQQDVIKSLFATGKQAEAQALILKELDVEFGGAAAAARDTLGGALEGLKNAWGDLFEVSRSSSSGVVGAINAISKALPKLDYVITATFGGFRLMWVDLQVGIQKFNAKVYDTLGSLAAGFAKFLSFLPGTAQSVKELTEASEKMHLKAGILRDSFEAWRKEQEGLITGTNAQTTAIRAQTVATEQLAAAQTKARASAGLPAGPGTQGGFLPMPGVDLAGSLGGAAATVQAQTAAGVKAEAEKRAAIILEVAYKNIKDREQIEQNFLRGLQESFARTFENIFTHGLRGFKDLFSSLGSLVAQSAAQFAASGLMSWGASTYRNAGGGLAGIAAIANPATLATTAILALGSAMSEGAERAREYERAVRQMAKDAFATFSEWVSGKSPAEKLWREWQDVEQKITDAFQKGGLSAESAQAMSDVLVKVYTVRFDNLKAEQQFLEQMREQDLRARELRARGFTAEADALALWNAQTREFADAVKAGWSTDMLAYLGTVQELERNQAAAARAAQEAAEAQQQYSDAIREGERLMREGAEAVAAAWDKAAEHSRGLADASESLAVRMARAQGNMAEADKLAFQLQQRQELRAAESEVRSIRREMYDLGIGRSFYNGVQNLGGGYAAPIVDPWWYEKFGANAAIGYQNAQAQLPAYQKMLDDQAAYIEQLKTVQAAEAIAFTNGQSMPGASAAVPGTAGSFNTIVSRATSAQGDRMMDELTTARTIQQTYLPYLKTIAERLSGGVNALLGNALQNDLSLAGSALVA